jgi:RimJ/RimL family protein N-acetyltransferase
LIDAVWNPKAVTENSLGGWAAPRPPTRVAILGRAARLEPLNAQTHCADLWAAFRSDDMIWRFMAYGPFASEAVFRQWLEARISPDDPLTFAIIDAASGRATGLLAMLAIRPETGVVEIGHIVLSPALQKTTAATEAIYLALKYLFTLGYRRVEWKSDERNRASKRAAKRFGFIFEGLFHQHMIVKGENRDTSWFAMLDREWPGLQLAFEKWLAPENFDPDGKQRRNLALFQPD